MRPNSAPLLLCPLSLAAGIAVMRLIWDNAGVYDHAYGPPLAAPLWLLASLWLCYCTALGAAVGLAGQARLSPDDRGAVIRLWLIELALCVLLALVFFNLEYPRISFALTVLLCILTGSGTRIFAKAGRAAGLLNFICLCWTIYLAYIALGICLIG